MLITIEDIRQAVARGWCSEANQHKEMDVHLAEAIAQEVSAMLERPLAMLHEDGLRIDALEAFVNKEGLLTIHTGEAGNLKGAGLGLRPGLTSRTLRQALDQLRRPT
jgi:hypothetical protein